jgi:monothiol glutaredoxin
MSLSEPIRQQITDLIQSKKVVLFMKGNRHFPQCGFSAQVVGILGELLPSFETVNVLSDPNLREGIKEFSSWPTIPQLYVDGQFVGGCDIVKELYASGELHKLLGVTAPKAVTPTITVTPGAAKAFKAADNDPGERLRLEVSNTFQYELYFGPKKDGDVEVESNGVKVLFDAASARRADGLTIDFVEGDHGGGFKITNPNEPVRVRPLSAKELKAMFDRGEKLALYDVRTPDERKIATIAQAMHLDDKGEAHLRALDKGATIVFHCHHGGRSRQAAERAVREGYKTVYNLEGGIDAWSQTVDASVPRY